MIRRSLSLLVLFASSCGGDESPAHPEGWAGTIDSPDFHGTWLSERSYPLADCQSCHGLDYSGGEAEVSCETADCHALGVDACGTCHGQEDDPLPADFSHESHQPYCLECHPVPEAIGDPGHIDGTVDIAFGGIAIEGGLTPSWDPSSQRCSNLSAGCHILSPTDPWNGSAASVWPRKVLRVQRVRARTAATGDR